MAEAEEVLLKLLLGLHSCDVPGAECWFHTMDQSDWGGQWEM